MSDTPKQATTVEVIPDNAAAVGIGEKEMHMIGTIVSAFAQPMAHAQETAAVEATKQTQIIADATHKTYRWFFIIGLGVLVLAGIALFKDKDQITGQLIVAMFSFLGGLGIGRSSKK